MDNIRLEKRKRKSKALKYAVMAAVILAVVFSAYYILNEKNEYKRNVVVGAYNKPSEGKDKLEVEELDDKKPKESDAKQINHNEDLDKQLPAKEVFLTFDDGPTNNITPEILDILKECNVKATFFVIGNRAKENKGLILREINEGHAVANHTYTHDYKYIYSSTENFMQDIKRAEDELKTIIEGYNSKLIRFPGGSFGRNLYKQAVTEAGYHFVDWNALNGDAEGNKIKSEDLVEKVKQTAKHPNHLVVLMHDAPLKETTVQALPQIIEYLKSQGYTFKTLE